MTARADALYTMPIPDLTAEAEALADGCAAVAALLDNEASGRYTYARPLDKAEYGRLIGGLRLLGRLTAEAHNATYAVMERLGEQPTTAPTPTATAPGGAA